MELVKCIACGKLVNKSSATKSINSDDYTCAEDMKKNAELFNKMNSSK